MRKVDALAAPCLAALLASWTLGPALGADYPLAPGAAAIGEIARYDASDDDTLLDVARRFDLGYTQLIAANRGVDPWFPGVRSILLPSFYLLPDAPHRGIVVNLAEERLFYFPPDGRSVVTVPIGVAVDGRSTPLGATRVVAKEAGPAWYPPASIRAEEPGLPRVIPPGPDNPLGAFALRLGWPDYLIHGTNKPDGVGRRVSHGCIRLYPEDIARLYQAVPVGMRVTVIDEPIEVGWVGAALFLEVHPDGAQALALQRGEAPAVALPANLTARVLAAAGDQAAAVDWAAVERAGEERSGVPVRIAERNPLRPIVAGGPPVMGDPPADAPSPLE